MKRSILFLLLLASGAQSQDVAQKGEKPAIQSELEKLSSQLDLRLFEFRLLDVGRQAAATTTELNGLEEDLRQFRARDSESGSESSDDSVLIEREIRRQQQLRTIEAISRLETLRGELRAEEAQLRSQVQALRKRLDLPAPPSSQVFALGSRS